MKTKGLLILVFLTLLNVLSFAQISGNLLKIQGEAVIYETPENMVINIDVRVLDSLYSRCSDLLIQQNNSLITLLQENSIPKEAITSEQIKIDRNFNFVKEILEQDGYSGNVNVKVILKFDTKHLNDLMNLLKKDSLNLTYSVSFQLTATQKEKLLMDATKLAITDAQNKAMLIAESLKLKDLKIKEINYGYPFKGSELMLSDEVYYKAKLDNDFLVFPRPIEVKKGISIIWEFKQ
ncbi:MAG: SIMPL domain-containing protein [Bacteroidales bacterium]